MESKQLFLGVLPHWNPNNSYLLFEKIIGETSYGKIFTRYKVVKRWSAQGWGEEGIFTDSLVGIEYTPSEIILL
jgi:hypothetical protein